MIGPTADDRGRRFQDTNDDDDNNMNNPRIPVIMTTFEERERSQRVLRLLMMILMLLILMDGEQEPNQRNRPFHESAPYLRSGIKSVFIRGKVDGLWSPLSQPLFEQRRDLDQRIYNIAIHHPRHSQLIKLNHNRKEEQMLREAVIELIQRSFHVDNTLIQIWRKDANSSIASTTMNPIQESQSLSSSSSSTSTTTYNNDNMIKPVPDSTLVYYYPKNSTGFYRGYWRRFDPILNSKNKMNTKDNEKLSSKNDEVHITTSSSHYPTRDIGVYMIPRDTDRIYNFTSVTDSLISQYDEVLAEHDFENESSNIALTMQDGYIKIQLLSRPVPAMDELSLVDGFVKIFDGNYTTFSSSNGLLLRVRGVVIHSIGKISLVANDGLRNQSSFVLYGENNDNLEDVDDPSVIDDVLSNKIRRRLDSLKQSVQSVSSDLNNTNQQLGIKNIREEAFILFPELWKETPDKGNEWKDLSSDLNQQKNTISSRIWDDTTQELKRFLGQTVSMFSFPTSGPNGDAVDQKHSHNQPIYIGNRDGKRSRNLETATEDTANVSKSKTIRIQEPFVPDDDLMTTLEVSSMGRLASHEKDLFLNGINCDFEMNFYIQESQWTIAEWRRSLYMAALRVIFASPSVDMKEYDSNSTAPLWLGDFFLASDIGKKSRTGNLVMSFSGLIESPNCAFYSQIQAEALRIDWDRTAGKAVSYSFYMVILCVFEIILYLQQLLHSQSQSSASRVSVIGIAWQTVIDAMICVGTYSSAK